MDEDAENPDIRTDENGIKKIQYEVNDVLKLRIEDKNQETGKELETYMEEKREILENILKGESQYQDSLGWFHTQ